MYTVETLTNMCEVNNIVLPTEEIVKLSNTLKDLSGELILLTIRGSRAYGTAIEGKSDYDFAGVYITDTEEILASNPSNTHSYYKPQLNDSNNDIVLYEVGRFIDLLQVGNPNILELLNTPLDCLIYKSYKFDKYFSNTKHFITKQLRNSFVGYAKTQISKATGLNKKMNNPQPKDRKDILEFCYVINGGKSRPFWGEFVGDEHYKYPSKNIAMDNMKHWGIAKLSNGTQLYKIFVADESYNFRGIIKDLNSTQFRLSSIPKEIEDNDVHPILVYFNLDGFKKHTKDHREYWEWVEKRNQERYKINMEHGKNYDCYVDCETEYLTDKGWKRYDDITDEKLGTINNKDELIFSTPIDRVDKLYDGIIYSYEDRYTKFSVTENHNLFVQRYYRKSNGEQNVRDSKWGFIKVKDYVNNIGRSYYKSHLHNKGDKSIDTYSNDWWFIIGAYVGDGHVQYSKKGKKGNKVVEIRISQLESKPLFKELLKLGLKKYKSKETKGGINWIFCIRDAKLINFIVKYIGIGSKNKRLPHSITSNITISNFESLMRGLMLSDGTVNKKSGNNTYYSINKKLINDLQLMLFERGYYCQIYTYTLFNKFNDKWYKMYHLNLGKNYKKSIKTLSKTQFRKVIVSNKRVTCFTMYNGILITRNSNKIAIQGNSKNISHCVRLIEMAEDLVTKKEIIVRRPNKDYLLDIKSGKFKYDEIMGVIDEKVDKIDNIFLKSNLPDKVDKEYTKKLLTIIRLDNLKEYE